MITPYDSVVVRTVCKLLIPFAQVFGLYVLFHGHDSPGGGFQGGSILGASVILGRLTVPRVSEPPFPTAWGIALGAVGVLIYGLVGLVPLLFGGTFLDYGAVPLPGMSAAEVRHLGILGVETGVAIGVSGVMVSIFEDLAPKPEPAAEARRAA
jgi:multicomponent Na+:H+ antiporter subunit B